MPTYHTTPIYLVIIGVSSLLNPSVASIVPAPSAVSPAGNGVGNQELQQHFKDFSYNLLLHSDLDEFSVEKGAAISSPWGVGYMLANINEQIWNVSNEGVGAVLKSKKVADDYQALIERMQKVRDIQSPVIK